MGGAEEARLEEQGAPGGTPGSRDILRVLIVDDEYPARAELRYRLEQYEHIQITGEAATAREALRLIEALEYDVVFLDVEMPGLSGVELARILRERSDAPRVVFVTAYENYAVDAFAIQAVDYLLKPFEDSRLQETLQRLAGPGGQNGVPGRGGAPERPQAVATGGAGSAEGALRDGPEEVFRHWLPTFEGEKTIPVPLKDIIYITAEDDRVFVQVPGARLQTRYTLQTLEERLPPERFFRCHRGFIVHLNWIREISPYFNGTYMLTMKDRERSTVPVARSRVKELKALFWPEVE